MDSSKKRKILIVEDEPTARKLYLDMLLASGFEAAGAGDGKECLKALENTHFDLVLLDIIMPEMDGISTLEEIKKDTTKYGTPKILMLSNIGGDMAIDKAMEIGADGYMLKSETEPTALISIVNKYLDE
jgi:CheY-like chemotaxis protein